MKCKYVPCYAIGNFLDAFKLVGIINENHLKELYVLMLSFIMQAMLQGNGGLFSEPHLPPGGMVFQIKSCCLFALFKFALKNSVFVHSLQHFF